MDSTSPGNSSHFERIMCDIRLVNMFIRQHSDGLKYQDGCQQRKCLGNKRMEYAVRPAWD